MNKKKTRTTIIISAIILVLAISIYLIGVGQKSIWTVTPTFPLQFVILPNCDTPGQSWVCKHPYALSQSNTAIIGDYKVVTSVENTYKEEFQCLSQPLASWDGTPAVKTTVDSDGCQHWTYNEKRYQDVCDCMGYFTCYSAQNICYGNRGEQISMPPQGCIYYNCAKVETGIFSVDYGGKKQRVEDCSKASDQCWGLWKQTNVYKKVVVAKDVSSINSASNNGVSEYVLVAYTNQTRKAAPVTIKFSDMQIILYNQEVYDSNNHIAIVLTNQFAYQIPDDSFRFNITLPTDIYQGETIIVGLGVENYYKPTIANLSVEYRAPSIIGEVVRVDSKIISLPTGKSNYSYALEGKYVTENLKVTPRLTVLQDTTGLQGVNLPNPVDGKLISSEKLPYYEIGKLQGDTATIQIRSQAERIVQLEGTVQQQAAYIKSLQLSVANNSAIISQLDNTISEQYQLIQLLSKNKAEQDTYVANLLTQIQFQQGKVAELQKIVDINADILAKMNATVEQQLTIIAGLNKNVAEKNEIIIQLTNKLTDQDAKIKLMQQVAEQLGNDYTAAKATIIQLQSQLGSADDRVQFLLLTVDELKLSNNQVADLLNSYNSKLSEDASLIGQLRLSNNDLAALIVQYKGDLTKQEAIINELNLSNQQINTILEQYRLKLAESQEATSKLQISLTEEEKLLNDYKNNLISQQTVLDKLRVSNDDLTKLLAEYKYRNEQLQKIQDAIQTPKTAHPMPIWLLITIGIVTLLMFAIYFREQKRKRR